jgi:hypothetical protein
MHITNNLLINLLVKPIINFGSTYVPLNSKQTYSFPDEQPIGIFVELGGVPSLINIAEHSSTIGIGLDDVGDVLSVNLDVDISNLKVVNRLPIPLLVKLNNFKIGEVDAKSFNIFTNGFKVGDFVSFFCMDYKANKVGEVKLMSKWNRRIMIGSL